MILKSYLLDQFAHNKPLVLAGSLYFEQSYSGIEGDSASGAELAALLSAISGVPVRRSLAFTGAVRDAIMDVETLACHLILLLAQRKPEALTARFKIVPEEGMSGWDLLEAGARKRGFLISGGEVDLERMANILLDEFRAGKMGRITLELPEDLEREEDDHGTA